VGSEAGDLAGLLGKDRPLKRTAEIVGAGERTAGGVAIGMGDAKNQGFEFLDVLGFAEQVEAEAVPFAGVAVVEMLLDTVSEVGGQADVGDGGNLLICLPAGL